MTTHAYNIYEAKTHLSRLVNEVEAGEEVVISRNGRPVAKLVPVEPERKPRVPGSLKGKIWISDDFDEFTEQDEKDWYGE
ncbi:type II toxin-antitoxin system prevent-host-death family antitoxin [Humibacter soli]